MYKKEKIILITPLMSSFIRGDISILSSQYNVKINTYNWKNKSLAPWFLLRQLLFLLINLATTKKVIVEFGGYWSVLPSILGKMFSTPVYIVLHGTDCASIPKLNYGSLRIPLLRKACEISYRNATKLLPVSESLVSIENNFQRDLPSKQGYKNFFPDIETDYKVLYNGIDEDYWKVESEDHKEEKTFLAVFSEEQFYLKGGDLIFEVAERFKDCKFKIVGASADKHEKSPSNVELLGRLSLAELREQYQKSQFHFQLSVIEGFGVALCEAMLCKCIPIGSSVNMIPEIIGDTGFVLKEKNADLLADVINDALVIEDKLRLGKEARNRVIENFSFEKRKKGILDVLAS